jgi:four helix bundle protein
LKEYDLEERTYLFAKAIREFVQCLPKSMVVKEDGKQLVRSSGSVGANYIEANEALSRKDFIMRIKICRKEAKESKYWLRLIEVAEDSSDQKESLIQEATELMNIFGAILRKTE